MVPRQLTRHWRGTANARKEQMKLVLIGAYQTAALTRAKKLPNLERLIERLDRTPADKRRMTWQQMLTVARQWTAYRGAVEADAKKRK